MSKIFEPHPIEVYNSWCNDIVTESSDDLSDWESSFIASISERLGRKQNLSELQANKLEQLYTKYTK